MNHVQTELLIDNMYNGINIQWKRSGITNDMNLFTRLYKQDFMRFFIKCIFSSNTFTVLHTSENRSRSIFVIQIKSCLYKEEQGLQERYELLSNVHLLAINSNYSTHQSCWHLHRIKRHVSACRMTRVWKRHWYEHRLQPASTDLPHYRVRLHKPCGYSWNIHMYISVLHLAPYNVSTDEGLSVCHVHSKPSDVHFMTS